MGNHRCKCRTLGQLNGCQGLRKCPNLIELDENRVGRMFLNPPLEALGVGHEEVISYQLHPLAQSLLQLSPSFPVIFGQTVFDGDDRIYMPFSARKWTRSATRQE